MRSTIGYFIVTEIQSLRRFTDFDMQTILGPFEPYLENAIVDEICAHKAERPLAPLLVLVPSTALRQHLKSLLSRRHRLSLLNVYLLTFDQLTLRLFAEISGKPPELRDDLFLEEVLRRLVRARQPGAEAFAGIEERIGGCAALWQTLRDLRDGMVDAPFALEATRENPWAGKDRERTRQLLVLLQTLLDFCRDKGIKQLSDVDQRAIQRVPASDFLKQFDRIFYYGFYDLTQIQLDFFHAVAQTYPTTLFFPLLPTRPSHDGWSFAERFYERHVQGYNTVPARELVDANQSRLPATFGVFDEYPERSYASPPEPWRGTIVNTFGIHDEVAVAAKEILRLVEQEKLEFDEIGVVVRSLEAYGVTIKEIFGDHQIPVNGEIEEPLVQFPLVKAVILLANLPARNFLRSQVIDLLSSPYFQITGLTNKIWPVRPDLWDLASRELAICKGIQEWRRLRNYAHRDLFIHQLSHDDESRSIKIDAQHIRCLADIVDALAADLLTLPQSASWRDYAEAWKKLLAKYLGISAGNEAPEPRQQEISDKILAVLDEIAALDAVNEVLSLIEFSETFQRWLERSALAAPAERVDGVRVLGASAARGLSFRTLFILGLNEGVFPRTIREDAFLRDRDREVLERDLGYKVNPKLAAFDEEKLIFTLLVGAAREKLYCSFQRADDNGRALAPSWYLSELKRAFESAAGSRRLAEFTIPRNTQDKSTIPPFDRDDLLLPEELAIRLSLGAEDPSGLIANFITAPKLYNYGRKAVAELDQSGERLSSFDGAVGPLPAYWNHFSKRVSPTALETYARCPFQFFARHVLGLERLERPEETAGPSPADYGELGHSMLNGVYRVLIDADYFNGKTVSVDPERVLAEVARQAFADYEKSHPVGYPLSWDCLKEDLVRLIGRALALDLNEIAESGFAPVILETDMSDTLPEDWPDPVKGLTIRGRMDRIDHQPKENRFRVIDYKFKFSANATIQDRNLDRAALRGERLQPPFYRILGQRWADEQNLKMRRVDAKFYYIAPRWRDGPLVSAEFNAEGLTGKFGAEVKKTIADLADGIRLGRFHIQRGAYCGHCEVAEICRKNHPPSLWRAENDAVTLAYRAIQDKDPEKL